MPTPDELAAKITAWLDEGHELAEQVAALDDTPPVDPPAKPAAPAKPARPDCVIRPDMRPALSWVVGERTTAWEVHNLLDLTKTLQAVVTEPYSLRSPLKPDQHRRYALIAIGPGGRSEMSDSVDVPPASGPPPPPGAVRYPADITGTKWYLTLPTGTQGSPDTVKMPALATYTSKYLELNPTPDGAVFRCWHGGVTTKGSPNPRSELRETNPDGSLAWWPMRTGRHAMTVVGQVNRLTKVRPHVVLHQIHGRSDDTTVWRLEGTRLYITNGDDTHAHLVTDTFQLGTRYELVTEVADGRIRYRYNGDPVAYELPAPADDGYFKVGAYLQSNATSAPGESTSEFTEVVVFNVTVTHAV